jgi:hypothetical protein
LQQRSARATAAEPHSPHPALIKGRRRPQWFGSATLGGIPVVVDANGQLGTSSSSRRYKQDIDDMGSASRRLLDLRPVTFRYITRAAEGDTAREYGLIAEEVAEVYPDLVVRGADGRIETVQYQKLTPMLTQRAAAPAADDRRGRATDSRARDAALGARGAAGTRDHDQAVARAGLDSRVDRA